MPIHPDYKMLSDEDVNMQLAEGIYDQNDPNLFNADEWARNKYGTKQIPLTQPQQQTLQQNIDAYRPETNNVNQRNWYQSQMSGAEKDYRGIPQSQPLPSNPAPAQQGADPEQVLEYLSQKYPQAKPLVEKARARKQVAAQNVVFPDQRIVGRVPPIPGIDKERAFGMQDPFSMVKKSPSDMNEQEYKAYIAKLNELSRPDYVRQQNEVFGDMNITGQVPPLPEEPRTDYYDGLPEWGGNEPEEPMISEQVGEVPPRSEIVEQDLPPEIDPRLENTTIGRMAMSAKDPRLLMAHLAQFAGEFGNLRGKPTESTAMPFYQAQIALEQQQRENAFKQQQLDTQRYAEDIKAKKTEQGSDPALAALRRVQTDLAVNKLQTEQELRDPNSERSQNLRETMRELAARQGYTFPKKDSLRGADVLPMIRAMVAEMQMNAQAQRAVQQTQSAEQRAEADKQFREQQAQAERAFREQEAQKNRQLQRELLQTRGEQQKEIKQTVPGKAAGSTKDFSNALPGWQQVEQIDAVTPQEIKAFRDRTAKVPRVVQKINELKSMINKYGGYENTFSAEGARMNSLANDIKLDLKGPEFKALGVLAGPDMNILEALVPDTTKMLNQTRGKAINAALTQLAKNLEDDLVSSGRSIGYQKVGGSGESGPKKTSSGKIIFGE